MQENGVNGKRRSLWLYLRLRLTAALLRFPIHIVRALGLRSHLGLLPKSISIKPSYTTFITSSQEPSRRIKLNIYYPPESVLKDNHKLPVHISFHGSGFVVPCLGQDAEQCAWIANTVGCVVIDADYAKAPERPFPAAYDDAKDAALWAISEARTTGKWNPEKVTIGGYSAGANLALAVAVTLPQNSIKSVIAWYPPTDWVSRREKNEEVVPLPKHQPGVELGPKLRRFFDQCYALPELDITDVRISPENADPSRFPPVLCLVGDRDPLFADSLSLVEKLRKAGRDAETFIVENAGHGWDKFSKSPPYSELLVEAMHKIAKRLQDVHA
ncbi:alpha/beta-hydrolase [Sistotremastrum niveocremeum HHB9708]|uniref:Alpha/beta-hydrolase n=1 Tax=Sistotremastrum niveocremeum HHB9708 TaxID=1314777 RepID=A0A164URD3_9AGAM|nr:alpha/beta-hydrolase [Sistotremastrum niveocremeum HHB9708]